MKEIIRILSLFVMSFSVAITCHAEEMPAWRDCYNQYRPGSNYH